MEKEDVKRFELNNKTLENFDQIMSTKLDEIEELKITGLDKGSKLLNIVSLCANVKTLIIEGDQRINSDKILKNIFKPEKLENLVLNSVKLPKSDSLKRYTNLKMVSLNGIRGCNVKNFLEDGIVNNSNLEIVNISNSDMSNIFVNIFSKFLNLKYLSLDNVTNCKFDDLSFLNSYKNILKISIVNNQIPITQINSLLKCRCSRNISLNVADNEGKMINNFRLEIGKENQPKITLPGEKLEEISKAVNLYRVNKINVMINNAIDNSYYIKLLKKFKKEIRIIIKNFSVLNVEQAKKIKQILQLDCIRMIENGNEKEYDINSYIEIRTEIDGIINRIQDDESEPEKFLRIYKLLGQEFDITENEDSDLKNKICNMKEISQVLQDCLQCVNIESNIIYGDELENEREHSWNQVKINGNWYNADLGLDAKNIKKKKVEYCLLGDDNFLDSHTPKSGKNQYCSSDFNNKFVNVFLKTGLFKEQLLVSYVEVILNKIKRTFNFNKENKILVLPSGDEDKK